MPIGVSSDTNVITQTDAMNSIANMYYKNGGSNQFADLYDYIISEGLVVHIHVTDNPMGWEGPQFGWKKLSYFSNAGIFNIVIPVSSLNGDYYGPDTAKNYFSFERTVMHELVHVKQVHSSGYSNNVEPGIAFDTPGNLIDLDQIPGMPAEENAVDDTDPYMWQYYGETYRNNYGNAKVDNSVEGDKYSGQPTNIHDKSPCSIMPDGLQPASKPNSLFLKYAGKLADGESYGENDGFVSKANDDLVGTTPGGVDDDGETLDASFIEKILDWLIDALTKPSPLVLDLDGDGVELTSLNSADSIYWKHDPTSDFAVASGWVNEDDGFLAVDVNDDGVINDSGELFGNQTGYANGFLALADYDSNADDVIDDSDINWDDLRVWIDANGNGYSEEDELHTLDELLITEIDLNYSTVNYQIAGNDIYQESTFTIDGQTHDIVDAYFKTSTTNTVYNQNFDLDVNIISLPELRGYGELPYLGIAMSLDNEDTEGLLNLVAVLSNFDYASLGVENDAMPFYAAVEKIMLRWAGVDDVVSDSRGNFIDARYLEFVEKITGQAFTQLEGGDDPLAGPAPVIMETWGIAHQAIAARLAYQLMDGHELFDDAPLYDSITDTFGDSTGVDFDALETFLTHTDYFDHLEAARLAVSWTEEIIGFDNLTTQEKADFEDLLPQNVTLEALLADPQYSSTGGTGYLYGDANDNFMVTPSTTEETVQNFSSGDGNDLLISGPAAQNIYAYGGNDVMIAGTGRQTMNGYGGDDLYVFAPGTGQMDGSYYNTIQESASNGTDTLRITGGVNPDDVYSWTTSNGYLYVQYTDTDFVRATASATGGASRVGERLEKIVFDDETEWDLTTGLTLHNNDTSRTFYGSTGNDVMIAGGGSDKLYGKSGDDILESGGGAADWLYGDAGADIFRFMEDTGYDALDLIKDFDAVEGDAIDIADLLTGYNPLSDTISDFVSLTESGGHTTLAVDKDGTGGTYSFADVARIDSTTGLDLNDMITNSELLIA